MVAHLFGPKLNARVRGWNFSRDCSYRGQKANYRQRYWRKGGPDGLGTVPRLKVSEEDSVVEEPTSTEKFVAIPG